VGDTNRSRARRAGRIRALATAGIVFCCLLAGITALGPTISHAASMRDPRARSARELTMFDKTYLHLVGSPGIEITEKGTTYGTFSGSVSSHFTVSGSHISGTFVFYTHGGLVRGSTYASVIGKAALPVVSFAGNVLITSGTGSYSHASGRVSLKGSIRRKNYEIFEQTSGKVHV
jgi:hypothetical protein